MHCVVSSTNVFINILFGVCIAYICQEGISCRVGDLLSAVGRRIQIEVDNEDVATAFVEQPFLNLMPSYVLLLLGLHSPTRIA